EGPGPPWQEAWDGPGGTLWRNPAALPLFFMPASWRRARDAGEALRFAVGNQDFRARAMAELGESREAGEPAPEAGHVAWRQEGTARIRGVSSNGFELDVETRTGGLTVSSVSFSRGWRLALDGRAAPLLRVNGGFLGFLAPPGAHRAALEYR